MTSGNAVGPSSQNPQYLGPDGDHRYKQRQRGERGGFLDYCFEHIALQRNSPSPSQVRIKLIRRPEVPVARFRIPTINRVISGFFHTPPCHPRALSVPQERDAGSSVGL
jgi:hypothetical protein